MLLGVTPEVLAGRLIFRPEAIVGGATLVGSPPVASALARPFCHVRTLLFVLDTSSVVAPVDSTCPLGLTWKPAMPSFAPSSRVKLSVAITSRDSISTCLTGRSSTDTSCRIYCRSSGAALTSRGLVRSSNDTLPRGDRKPRTALLDPPPPPTLPVFAPDVRTSAICEAVP